ncbi:MAG: RNA-binding protein [Candidatus Berkelbacteria bacterium]|nr:RNA-binding protein [Candidatus Berkelbacteria bacterium]
MPKGPDGQNRPADIIGNAVKVMRIAIGEEQEEYTPDGKNKAAFELGRRGGKARAEKLSPERRRAIAKLAAEARWGKQNGSD